MGDLRTTNRQTAVMSLKKLVTVARDLTGSSTSYQTFTYKGQSSSEKTSVELNLPECKENLMFYEHFNQPNEVYPTLLSFIYLQWDNLGIIHYDFSKYSMVTRIDVCSQFKTVRSVFGIVRQLLGCNVLRFILTNENIQPSQEDESLMASPHSHPTLNECLLSKSVKTLELTKVRNPGDKNFPADIPVRGGRVGIILGYASQHLPALSSLLVNNLDGNGATYEMIHQFCNSMKLPKHDIKLSGGKISCAPKMQMAQRPSTLRYYAQPTTLKNMSRVSESDLSSSSHSHQGHLRGPSHNRESYSSPTPAIKIEPMESAEVIESESVVPQPKKRRHENSSCESTTVRNECAESVTSCTSKKYGSRYEDWEGEGGEGSASCSSMYEASQVAEKLSSTSFSDEDIKKILSAINGGTVSSENPRGGVRTGKKMKNFVEGIHFERPPPRQ